MTAEDQPPGLQLPRDTTPTWEMELLVSGATIFGLMQLPALLDRGYFTAINLSSADYFRLVSLLWMYSKIAVITLAITFIVHLVLRGYWVALVGMDSVYPGGIRWDNLAMGPIARARSERHAGSMPANIERADNRATRVFGTGFGFAMVMMVPALAMLLLLASSMLVDVLFGPGYTLPLVGLLTAIILVPWFAASLIDRQLAHRLAPGGRVTRALSGVLEFYSRLGIGQRDNALIALFISHEGRRKAGLTSLLVILPVIGVVMVQSNIAKGELPLGLSSGLASSEIGSPSNSPAAFYADSGVDRAAVLPIPHLATRVATGPYLPLFVPFIPRLHGPRLASTCPEAVAIQVEPGGSTAQLECMARLTAIKLDGVAIIVPLDSSTDPQTGQAGLLAMLPVASLPSGRHEVSLNRPDGREGLRYRIPFWK